MHNGNVVKLARQHILVKHLTGKMGFPITMEFGKSSPGRDNLFYQNFRHRKNIGLSTRKSFSPLKSTQTMTKSYFYP